MNLPESNIKFGSKAEYSACFIACGREETCSQAWHHDGRCYPMSEASLPNGTQSYSFGWTSIHCNAGRGNPLLCDQSSLPWLSACRV